MGQTFALFLCFRRNTVVPLNSGAYTAPSSTESNAVETSHFHRPQALQEKDWPHDSSSGTENPASFLSERTSMATISLGSVQTISTTSVENHIKENQSDETPESGSGDLERSSSHYRRPGLRTPEPQEIPLRGTVNVPFPQPAQGTALPSLTLGDEAVWKQKSKATFSGSPLIVHPSLSWSQSRNAVQSSANLSTSSSRHTRAGTPRPRGPMLINVQPFKGRTTPNPAPHVCKHGIVLKSDEEGDTHEASCVRCERPQSKGGRMLQQMMESRKEERRRKRQIKAEKKRLMEEERERRRLAKEAIDNALQKFAELQKQKEEGK